MDLISTKITQIAKGQYSTFNLEEKIDLVSQYQASFIKERMKRLGHLGEVKKGYTYFRENDVIFAKITPCMENGKSALGFQLQNRIGFGSTEFHVLRARNFVLPKWIFYFVRRLKFRLQAAENMTGTAGQQRVPKSFLDSYPIQIPPIDKQRKIIAKLDDSRNQINFIKSQICSLTESYSKINRIFRTVTH
jgi:restriction endonuclease S subunit